MRNKNAYAKRMEDFTDTILVCCPGCNKKAIVIYQKPVPGKKDQPAVKKVSCIHCGFNKSASQQSSITLITNSNKILPGNYIVIGLPIDPFFHLPLYLVTDCCKNQLWAYNAEHLVFLKNHIGASLRERDVREKQNNSIGSRLPKWMSAAKNRDAILKAISFLETKL